MGIDIRIFHQRSHRHHVLIIVSIAMLNMRYSTRYTNLYYHASMLTLQTFLILRALWLPHA